MRVLLNPVGEDRKEQSPYDRDLRLMPGRNRQMRMPSVAIALVCILTANNAVSAHRPLAPRPSSVFLGVACHVGGDPRCGRVGVAVWLPRIANHVSARLLGRTVELSTSHAGSRRYRYERFWTGFFHVAASPIHPSSNVPVRVAVTLGSSHRSSPRTVYLLQAGARA